LPPELLAERQQLIESIDQIMASGPIEATVSKSAARAGVILDFLRKEKLRSKSAMLQDYESFIETIGQNVLIEIQLNMTEDDPDLTQRIQTAARDHSSLAVSAFTGAALRDHTAVKIDISTALLHTPEARAEKAQAFGQNFGNTMTPAEREGLIRALGLEEFVKNEESASVKRARRMISRVISGQTDAAFTMKGVDVARVMAPVFQREILSDRFYDHEPEIQEALIGLFDQYAAMAAEEQAQMMQLQMAMAQGGQAQPKEQP
jgi:hypothetical protein